MNKVGGTEITCEKSKMESLDSFNNHSDDASDKIGGLGLSTRVVWVYHMLDSVTVSWETLVSEV